MELRQTRMIGVLALTLAIGVAACAEDTDPTVSDPTTAADAGAGLTPEESMDLANAEKTGNVAQGGQELTPAERDALADAKSGENEVEVLAAGGAPLNLQIRTHSGNYGTVNLWYNYPQFGGWVGRVCVKLPKPGTWLNTRLNVPPNVDVFFDGFKTANKNCNVNKQRPDLQVKLRSPSASNLTNWWVDVF